MSYERPVVNTGFRKVGYYTLCVNDLADGFNGLPEDTSRTQVLAAFKRAAPYLGISPALRDTIDLLFAYSSEKDWEGGRRPIVWPSNRTLQDEMCLSLRAVQNRLRELEQRGLVAVVESANGKRYGRRDRDGYIIEAFGFDLSPLAGRLDEFFEVIERGRAERAERKALRRSITITRKAIVQIGYAALEEGFDGADWAEVIDLAGTIAAPAARLDQIKHLRDVLADLSDLHEQAEEAWRMACETAQTVDKSCGKDVDTASQDAENCTLIQLQPNQPSFKKDTRSSATPAWQGKGRSRRDDPSPKSNHPKCGTVDEHVERYRLNPRMLSDVFPELGLNLLSDYPGWSDVHDSAYHLCFELGISQDAWGDACRLMGRDGASIAVAVIAAKATEIRSPGGYLRKMSERARTGDLHLGPSVFAIRDKR